MNNKKGKGEKRIGRPAAPKAKNPPETEKPRKAAGKADGRGPEPADFSLNGERLTVEIEGVNQTRLINRLKDADIRLIDVKKPGGRLMRLTVRKKESQKTFAILEELCYTYKTVRKSGLFSFFWANRRRAGIAAGLAAALILFFTLTGSILRIEVNDLSEISRRDLIAALAAEGIAAGTRINGLDREDIRRVVNAYPGVAESSVEITGSTLRIHVIEKTAYLPPPPSGRSVIAAYDAEITGIVTASGTARVGPGRRVKAGDVLIEGAVYDTNGAFMREVPASGTVYGRIVKTVTETVPLDVYEIRRTGRTKRRTRLSLFGFSIGRPTAPYAAYESRTSSAAMNVFVPLTFTQTAYFETESVLVTRTPEEICETMRRERLAAFIDRDAKNLTAETRLEPLSDSLIRVHVHIQGELTIGQTIG
ncbi:MAG: sporulation protein YqfD [Clostridiales bacterium]|nr:sporulation protein YqfD [Clostridiales bacterium]